MITVSNTATYKTNKDLVLLQSRLYSPSYAGPGKWIVYNPATKKAFLAVGKDRLPYIVPLLTQASKNPIKQNQTVDKTIMKLVEEGLLTEAELSTEGEANTFAEKYHKAVYNFPFRDYHDKEWLLKDHETMDLYTKLWDQPPVFTKRQGNKKYLKVIDKAELKTVHSVISEGFIMLLLKTVFGSEQSLDGYPNRSIRKISPSGGAKHPTEAVLFLYKDYGELRKGVYTYDAENHALIENHSFQQDYPPHYESESISILIRSRVERPMWRYREIRSFRAVMIDAGHVIENNRQLCEYNGFYTTLTKAIHAENIDDFDWVREPHLCTLHVSPETINKSNLVPDVTLALPASNRYNTNPCIYFTFKEGQLICNTLWPNVKSSVINYEDFEVLTHCLPSRRGDRDISQKGLLMNFSIGKTKLAELSRSYLLIPENIAKKLYSELLLWINHNWYMSFLLHCEVQNSSERIQEPPFRRDVILRNPDLLFERKTTRKFSGRKLSLSQFNHILKNAIPIDERDTTELIVNVKHVETIEAGLYVWRNSILSLVGEALSGDQVRTLVIGQEWAGTGAVDIWIKKQVECLNPAMYEMSLMSLGAVGQRICIACTEEGISTFMTPAIKDEISFNTLKMDKSLEIALYHFTIGYKGE